MDKFIETLPVVSGHNIYMISKYDEDNICAKAQVATMKEKGWLPYYSNGVEWLEYEGGYDTTGIDSAEVGNGDEVDANAPAYDLNANRVEGWQNRKGVYIVNGKKVMVK